MVWILVKEWSPFCMSFIFVEYISRWVSFYLPISLFHTNRWTPFHLRIFQIQMSIVIAVIVDRVIYDKRKSSVMCLLKWASCTKWNLKWCSWDDRVLQNAYWSIQSKTLAMDTFMMNGQRTAHPRLTETITSAHIETFGSLCLNLTIPGFRNI